jgi:cell division protein FtsL
MKQSLRLLFILIPVGIFACLLIQMIVANEMIVMSDRLHKVDKRISELEEQNTYLRQQVVTLSAIKRVSEQAEVLGFVHPTNVIAFTEDSFPVAIKR